MDFLLGFIELRGAGIDELLRFLVDLFGFCLHAFIDVELLRHLGFERLDTEGGEDHHTETDSGHDHTIGNFAGSRGLFATSGQPTEECNTHGGETYYEAGIELLEDGSGHLGFCGYVQPEHDQQGGANEYHHRGDNTIFCRFPLYYCESGIDRHDAKE